MEKIKGCVLIIITTILFLLLGYFVFFSTRSDYVGKYNPFVKRQTERDSIIKFQSRIIDSLRLVRDKDIVYRDSLKHELDSAFSRIEKLMDTKVSEEDKLEALKWIVEHNSNLSQ